MDADVSYPAAKRRRTSDSPSTSRSRSRSRTPTRSRRDSPRAPRSRSYSPSPPRRRRRSSADSSRYARSQRSRSRDEPESRSRSHSPGLHDRTSTSNTSKRSLRFLPLHTLSRAHARGITCARFSPDGALLATASADATINIYTVPSNPHLPPSTSTSPIKQESNTTKNSSTGFKHIRTLRGHLAGVNALSWSPVSNGSTTNISHSDSPTITTQKLYTLASASDDKTILLWSPLSSETPISPSPLTAHSNYVSTLCFSPKGNMLASGSYDEAVMLWDVRSGRVLRQLPAHSDPVRAVDFICDGTMVCSCSTDGLIRIWDSGTGQCLRTLVDEARKGVVSALFAPNGKYILAWTLDGCVRLWDYVGGRCVKTYQGHVNADFGTGGVFGTYYPDLPSLDQASTQATALQAAFVASGSEDGDIVLWDVTTKELLWRGEGHKDVVLSVDYCTPSEGARGLLVSIGRDRDVRVWVEDVDDEGLRKRKDAMVAMKQQRGMHVNGDGANGMSGYAVDEDEDVDAQMIEEMEGGEGDGEHHEQHEDRDMDGNGEDGEAAVNGHAMELDARA